MGDGTLGVTWADGAMRGAHSGRGLLDNRLRGTFGSPPELCQGTCFGGTEGVCGGPMPLLAPELREGVRATPLNSSSTQTEPLECPGEDAAAKDSSVTSCGPRLECRGHATPWRDIRRQPTCCCGYSTTLAVCFCGRHPRANSHPRTWAAFVGRVGPLGVVGRVGPLGVHR